MIQLSAISGHQMSSVDLGFAQPLDPKLKWKLKNKFFPSKIGGKPVFLALKGLPKNNELKCVKCHQMMRFLLQVYAPIDDNENAFHRTLYVFCCPNNECSYFKVLRSQLSRNNGYYSSIPPDYENDDLSYDPNPQALGSHLCLVCGLPSDKKCSKCLKVSYCSKEHQIIDWKKGGHKANCGKEVAIISDEMTSSALFAESELIIGDNGSSNETDSEEGGTDSDSESEAKEMQKLNELLKNRCPEYQKQNLDTYEDNEVDEDLKLFNRFKRISSGEVIRYCSYDNNQSDSEPLWLSYQNKPNLPIPKCQYCGSDRRFEFQVMPQILNKIVVSESEASLDWGTLVIYTCAKSCSIDCQEQCEEQYKVEYIWKQPIN